MESLRGGEFTPSRTRWPRKAKFASFACRVEMTSRLDVLAICPSQSPTARSAASLRRVPWGGFPDFPGTISGLRPLPARPASLRCLRSAVPPVAPFAPRSRGAAPGPGPLLPRRPGRLLTVETGRYPKFLGDPCLHALLFDPGGPLASGHSDARDVAFRIYIARDVPSAYITTSAPRLGFRGSITRPTGSLCTLRSRGRPSAAVRPDPVQTAGC